MNDDTVCLSYVHGPQVAHSWVTSLVELLAYDAAHERRVVRGGMHAVGYKTGGIVESRNVGVERFLARDAEWLLWADTDIGFAGDAVDRLIASAHPDDRPIVGGLCFSLREHGPDGLGGWRTAPSPTLYRWGQERDGKQGYIPWPDYPAEELVPVAGTGSAFILIHRNALTKIGEDHGAHWYSQTLNETTRQLWGEDLSFCHRATSCGIPIHVDTRVKTSHHKSVWVSERDYRWAHG